MKRNGKEGGKMERGERKKTDATKAIFVDEVSSNYQCIYSIHLGICHCLRRQ